MTNRTLFNIPENSPVDRYTYVFHYQRADNTLIFRYDNTPHYPELPGFPHHKHITEEINVASAEPPDLRAVLDEIGKIINWEMDPPERINP